MTSRSGALRPVPELPSWLTDPRPVLALGTALWLLAALVAWSGGWPQAQMVCLAGLGVGVLGYVIFWVQRRGARRGNKGAQRM